MAQQAAVQQNPPTEQNTERLKKSRWRWFWRSLLVLIFLLLAILAFLASGTGQRLALTWVAKASDQLSFSHVEGSLQEGLTLTDVHYQMEGMDLQLGQLKLHIGFACLLDKAVCVEQLALEDLQLAVDTQKLPPSKPKEEKPLGEINLPLPVSLKQVRLDNIQIKVDDMAVDLRHFHSGVRGEGKHLQLLPTQLAGLHLVLPATQAVSSEQKFAKTSSSPVDWEALQQQLSQPMLTKTTPIQLPLNLDIPQFTAQAIQIDRQTPHPQTEAMEAQPLLEIGLIALTAKADEQAITLETLTIETDKGEITAQGQLQLTEHYPLNWHLQANTPELAELKLPASQVDLQLSGALFESIELQLQTQGAAPLELQGTVALAEPKTPFQLRLKSHQIQYPFIPEKGQDPLTLSDLQLALSGDLLQYQLQADFAMRGMNLPKGNLSLQGQGGLTEFELTEFDLNALQGKANLLGKVNWQNGVEWQSSLSLAQLNTKSLLPEWAAVLSGQLKSTGYVGRGKEAEEWAINVSEMDLEGNLFNKTLLLKGELVSSHRTLLNVPQARFIYGENSILLSGILDEHSDFLAQINAPNLQGLVPKLKASVNGEVRVRGNITKPELDLNLVANQVSYLETKLQHLTAKGSITTGEQIQGQLEVILRRFKHAEIELERANLAVSGSEQHHQLHLTSKGQPVAGNLQISGKFDRLQQRWQGTLSQVQIQSPVGVWKNEQAIQLDYRHTQTQADLSAHCWRNPKLTLCFPQALALGKQGNVPFEIKSLDLTMLAPFLSDQTQVSGIVSAKGEAAWFEHKSPVATVQLNANGIKFAQKVDYRTLPIRLNTVKLNLGLADDNLTLNGHIQVENNGRLVSDLEIKDLAKTRALSGNVQLEQLQLSLLKPFLNPDEKIAGNLNARLTLGGTALAPQLFGRLTLADLAASSNVMPFDVIGGNLALNFNGTSSTLKGNIKTPESNLALEGDANWKKIEAWHTRINAKAHRFRLDIPGIAKVDVSPDIEVKASPQELLLTGKIDIPWARISVEELPESAVSVSSDEVIMEGVTPEKLSTRLAKKEQGMAIKGDISINIGYDPKETVHVEAYGFNSDLRGTLKVRQGNKGLGLYGQVNLLKGKFASFGQDLIVRKGLISFTGLPSQPTLDVEAIRNPEAMDDPTIVAGVKVTGIADSPDVKVFSNPPMAQDQILSYLLTGKSLESSGDGSSSNAVAAALVGMSLSKSSKLVGGVGSAFGIQDLNVTTAGIGDNTKVVVGGSLNSRFKVKYAVGLFAPLTELTLRYRLAPSLYLQWISSINQAVDLMYRFEFD